MYRADYGASWERAKQEQKARSAVPHKRAAERNGGRGGDTRLARLREGIPAAKAIVLARHEVSKRPHPKDSKHGNSKYGYQPPAPPHIPSGPLLFAFTLASVSRRKPAGSGVFYDAESCSSGCTVDKHTHAPPVVPAN